MTGGVKTHGEGTKNTASLKLFAIYTAAPAR